MLHARNLERFTPERGPGGLSSRGDWPAGDAALHTFVLADGTIVGSETAGTADGVFAILGGTGRYAGAAGTYAVRTPEPDRDTAELAFTLKL